MIEGFLWQIAPYWAGPWSIFTTFTLPPAVASRKTARLHPFHWLTRRRPSYQPLLEAYQSYRERTVLLATATTPYLQIQALRGFWKRLETSLCSAEKVIGYLSQWPVQTTGRDPVTGEVVEVTEAILVRDLRNWLNECAKELSRIQLYLDRLKTFEVDRALLLLHAYDVRQSLCTLKEGPRFTHDLDETSDLFDHHTQVLKHIQPHKPCHDPIWDLNECAVIVKIFRKAIQVASGNGRGSTPPTS